MSDLSDFIEERISPSRTDVQASTDRATRERSRVAWREYIREFPGDGELQAPKLSQLREAMGFTQRELGNVLGLPEATIANAEAGKDVAFFAPTLQRFVRAAQDVVDERGA